MVKSGVIGKVIGVLFGLFTTVLLLPTIFDSVNLVTSNPEIPISVKSLASVLPMMYVVMGIIGASAMFVGTKAVIRYLKWKAFGNRMKEAYTAKFGGINPAFNEDVDNHIKVMETLGNGYTKSLNADWLKRMAAFVEIPYIIPEEEHLSEEQKAAQFEGDDASK